MNKNKNLEQYYNNEFERLSKDLNADERKNLLNKIKKDKQEADTTVESIKRREKKRQNQFALAKIEYEKTDTLTKIIIWILSLFTGKKREEVVLDKIFNNLKRELETKYDYIVDFKEYNLTNNFAKELLELSDACGKARPIIEKFFDDPFYYNSFMTTVLEKTFTEELKASMRDLHSKNFQVESEFIEREKIIREKIRRLKKFFHKLDTTSFGGINVTFKSFELLKRLIKFDFKNILYHFVSDDIGEGKITPKKVKFHIVDSSLQDLYSILDQLDFDFSKVGFVENMIEYSKNNSTPEIDMDMNFTETEVNGIKHVFEAIEFFKHKIPLKKIFQYFKQDILFAPLPLNVKVNFINIYKEIKEKEIDEEWDTRYEDLKEVNTNKLLSGLFTNYDFSTLRFFDLNLKNQVDKHSNVKLRSVKKLNLISHFIDIIYKQNIEKLINKLLIDGNFAKDSYRNNISTAYYLLYNCPERIKEFDKNLNPEKDAGRKINTFIQISTRESEYTKTLEHTIVDLNETTSHLIDEIFSSLLTINEMINSLLNAEEVDLKKIYNFDSIKFPGYMTPQQALQKAFKDLDQFFKVYNYIEDF